MKNETKHIEKLSEKNSGIFDTIPTGSISWEKSKEDIWPELLAKIENKTTQPQNTRVIYMQLRKIAVAAIFIVIAAIPTVMYLYTKTIKNSTGPYTEISLPDNSKVTIEANSVLSYKPLIWFIARKINFEGEAYFEVEKGKKFEVTSKNGSTIVLGTKFKIYSRNNHYNVTCTSGKVKVIESKHKNNSIIVGGQMAILKPDAQFEILSIAPSTHENSKSNNFQSVEDELDKILIENPVQKISKEIKETDKIPFEPKQETKPEDNKAIESPITNEAIQKNEELLNQNRELTSPVENETGNEKANTNEQNNSQLQKKDKFRASLTPKQLSILEDNKMSRDEKRKAFMESLTDEQKQLLKEQNEERNRQERINKEDLNNREKLKEQQQLQLREQLNKDKNKEQQKQQEKENTKPSTDKGNNPGNSPGGNNTKGN